jgi:glycosyltransferase involved in cell wall biosynthesis
MTVTDFRSAAEDDTTPPRAATVMWYWPFARPEEMDLAVAFAERGNEVSVHVIDRDVAPAAGRYGDAEVIRDLPDIDRSATGPRWPLSRLHTYVGRGRKRRAAMRATGAEIVHYHYANRFTDWLGRPPTTWVLSVHDVEPHQPRLGRLEHRLLRRLYARPDGLIVHHPWLADRLHADFGVDRERIAVVPHQVFPVAAPSPRPDSARPTVLLFGALRPNKGIGSMVDAMADERLAGVDLHIAGRGDPAYERRVASWAGTAPNVTAELGLVSTERKDELFRQASVVVLPYESFASQSGVLHDAYGHGRPVVVTDVGALGATVRHDATGAVVPVGDREALVEATRAMAGSAGDAPAAAALAVADAQSPQRVAEHLDDAYTRFRRSCRRPAG